MESWPSWIINPFQLNASYYSFLNEVTLNSHINLSLLFFSEVKKFWSSLVETKITKVRAKKTSSSSPNGQRITYLLNFALISWMGEKVSSSLGTRNTGQSMKKHFCITLIPTRVISQPDSEVTSAPPRGPFAAPSHHLDSQQEVKHKCS